MSYQNKCEKLYTDTELLKNALVTISKKQVDITTNKDSIQSIRELKEIAKLVLAAVDE